MSDDLQQILKDLHGITNNFNLTGQGVAGNLKEGFVVTILNPNTTDVPEGPEGPERPE